MAQVDLMLPAIVMQGGQASSTLIVKCHCCTAAWCIVFQSYHSHARTMTAGKAVDGGWRLAIVGNYGCGSNSKGDDDGDGNSKRLGAIQQSWQNKGWEV
jgi:hypothetical protein